MLSIWKNWKRQNRANKKRKAALAASVLFLSPAKSGRTWVRVMLSHAYHLTYGTPVSAVIELDNFHHIDARIPSILFTHISGEPKELRQHLTPVDQAEKTVICLLRDPRDVAVSRFHHQSHRSQGATRLRPESGEADAHELFPFLATNRHGLTFVIEQMNAMKRFADEHPNAHFFYYENFMRDAAAELSRMLSALGSTVPFEMVEAAVEFARFDNLQKREAEGFFSTHILQPGNPDEPNSFKVRRGKVGGYLDDLLPEQIAELDSIVDRSLVKGLGYRSEERASGSQAPADKAT